jgi:lipoprotein-anchoring transpeptidase ErfK/SrfK
MQHPGRKIHVSITRQTLELFDGGELLRSYTVSTSKFGEGTEPGSYKTPLGRFRIVQKIGDGAALGEIFKSRIATGVIGREDQEDDFVETRVLWLDGLDEENRNTARRFIYIHGTNHESEIGEKASHGCVRMRNAEVAELYDLVGEGTAVLIEP